LGIYAAIAVVAAALADPLVEFASNAGWFGAGSFTDHSNLDIIPALSIGVGLLALYMARKARAVLTGRVLQHGVTAALPFIFGLQILALYVMETAEQLVAWGHVLSPTTWLGGPLPISLAIHGVFCLAVALTIVRSKRVLAVTTLRVIRLLVAMLDVALRALRPVCAHRLETISFKTLLPLLCTIGERAPPIVVG
jgi:hypothetical protein